MGAQEARPLPKGDSLAEPGEVDEYEEDGSMMRPSSKVKNPGSAEEEAEAEAENDLADWECCAAPRRIRPKSALLTPPNPWGDALTPRSSSGAAHHQPQGWQQRTPAWHLPDPALGVDKRSLPADPGYPSDLRAVGVESSASPSRSRRRAKSPAVCALEKALRREEEGRKQQHGEGNRGTTANGTKGGHPNQRQGAFAGLTPRRTRSPAAVSGHYEKARRPVPKTPLGTPPLPERWPAGQCQARKFAMEMESGRRRSSQGWNYGEPNQYHACPAGAA